MRKLVVANWKMNPNTLAEARQLFASIEQRMHLLQKTDVVICPPFVYLPPLSHHSHRATLGTQNVAPKEEGALTGEISAVMVKNLKANHVILGHSERRIYFSETDADVANKLDICFKHGLRPILCLGGEAEAKKFDMKKIVLKQFRATTKNLEKRQLEKIIYVYEPTWAISTFSKGKGATGEHADEMINYMEEMLSKKIGKTEARNTMILYGGSVNKNNVSEFAKYPRIDGALVGAASLDSENFWQVIKEFDRESIHKI